MIDTVLTKPVASPCAGLVCIFVSSHETPGPGGCPAARHHVRPAPSPRFPRPCVCCSGALALSTSASLRLHPPAWIAPPQVLPPPRPAAAASAVASAVASAAASAVASTFVWLLLDAHLLLGGGLLDAEPLAADHGTVHRLRCTRSARAIAVPPPQYLPLPTIHHSLLNYSIATHFTIPASPCQPPRPWRRRRTRSPCSPG